MYQEVVFCRSIFEKLLECFKEGKLFDSKTYYDNLQLKKIKTIPSNWNLIERGLGQHEGFRNLFKNHIYTAKLDCSSLPKAREHYTSNEKIDLLINLANETEYKIFHTELRDIKNALNEKLLEEIELADISQFNKPPNRSRIVAVNRDISISRGEYFYFDKVLKSYFIQTKILIVSDKFVRNKLGYTNLKRFISLCPKLKSLTIYTDKKEDYPITVQKMRKEIKTLFKINPVIESASAHRRTITTDKFNIKIDPGLDFVNEEYLAEKHDADIQIEMLYNSFDDEQ